MSYIIPKTYENNCQILNRRSLCCVFFKQDRRGRHGHFAKSHEARERKALGSEPGSKRWRGNKNGISWTKPCPFPAFLVKPTFDGQNPILLGHNGRPSFFSQLPRRGKTTLWTLILKIWRYGHILKIMVWLAYIGWIIKSCWLSSFSIIKTT